jgi:hypothetical protein
MDVARSFRDMRNHATSKRLKMFEGVYDRWNRTDTRATEATAGHALALNPSERVPYTQSDEKVSKNCRQLR